MADLSRTRSIGPAVRRWWPLALTVIVTAATVWAAAAPWFGLFVGSVGMGLAFTGTGSVVLTGRAAEAEGPSPATAAGVVPCGYATGVLVVVALVLVVIATTRPGFVSGRAVASGVLGLAAVLSIAVWIAPDLMMSGTVAAIDEQIGPHPDAPMSFVAESGLITTIVATSAGSVILLLGYPRRSRDR